jgi:hypothetical protein
MCALSPVHVVLPASGAIGSTLRPDGSVEVYALEAQPFPAHIIIGEGGDAHVHGTHDEPDTGLKRWLVDEDGRLISKADLETPLASTARTVYAVSPDGNWFVGLKHSSGAGDQGKIVVWRRGTNDLIPIGVTPDQTSSPMVRGISNDGDVVYMAWVGEELRGFAWDRIDGLLSLKSWYAAEGNASSDAAKFTVSAISADGRTIVGTSGSGIGVRQQPTVWRDGVPSALPVASQEGEITDTSATSVSDDSRVIGGYVHLNTPSLSTTRVAVWVDGNMTLLPAMGPAVVVSGIGGDPTAWAVLGQNWIARSDGTSEMLHSYLEAEFGLSLNISGWPVELMASDDAIYLVMSEQPSTMCAGFNCYTSGEYATHLLVLPLDFELGDIDALDLSGDQQISPLDALIVINALNEHGSQSLLNLPQLLAAFPKIDTNGDGKLAASDALRIINFLNRPPTAPASTPAPAAEGEAAPLDFAAAADEYFSELTQHRRKNSARL